MSCTVGTINGWQSCKLYFLTKMLTGLWPFSWFEMTMKKAERHRAVDKNILFQDSVYLFSFEQSTVSGRRIISSCCFDLLIHFRGWCQRMATLDTSFWRPFKLYNGSLENAYICFLIIYGLHNIEMVIQIQCILINMNTTAQITCIFDRTSGESPIFSACAKASPID